MNHINNYIGYIVVVERDPCRIWIIHKLNDLFGDLYMVRSSLEKIKPNEPLLIKEKYRIFECNDSECYEAIDYQRALNIVDNLVLLD